MTTVDESAYNAGMNRRVNKRAIVHCRGTMLWKLLLAVLVIAAFLLGDPPTAQESKKEQSAKPLAGYSVLIVEKFKVEPAAVKAGFLEAQVPLMQAEIISQLVRKGIFDEVVDGSSLPPTQPGAQPPPENGKAKLLLSGTVTEFEPGSQAERYLVGFGAGATKLKMHFAFQDAASGKDILFTDHQHKFWIGAFGGSNNAARTRTAEGMVKSIVDDIQHNR
jgi:hypothetical protein